MSRSTKTHKIAVTAILSAVATILMFLSFPMPFLVPPFIKMDFSDLPALLGAFALGPVYGVVISFLKNVLHIFIKGTSTAAVGELSNFILGAVFTFTAGMIYKNAFARHDIERMKKNPEVKSYADFAKDATTKVNAKALYPYEVVAKAVDVMGCDYWHRRHAPAMDDTDRLMVNKYWENLADYFNGKTFNGLAVVDTSGSMTGSNADAPINVAISLGLYCAERAKGPFAGHYVSFSRTPRLIETVGADFCDKVKRIYETNLCENTNIEATFDMLLNTAIANHCSQDDLPQNIIVISDMEFDQGTGHYSYGRFGNQGWNPKTLMEQIRAKWANHGYRLPHLIYWNVQARQNNIPEDIGCGLVSYVSGMSPSIFETIMSGKTGYDLMMEKLNSERYAVIR